MPNNQNNTFSPRQPFRIRHRRIYYSLIILWIVVVASTAAFAIWQRQNDKAIAADKARFEQADKDVQAIAAEIQKQYPPAKQTYTKSCRYLSRDYPPRPVVCDVTTEFNYGVSNYDDANSLVQKINLSLKAKAHNLDFDRIDDESTSGGPFLLASAGGNENQEKGELLKDSNTNLSCPLNFELFRSTDPPPTHVTMVATKSFTLLTTFNCGGQAKDHYFPLEN